MNIYYIIRHLLLNRRMKKHLKLYLTIITLKKNFTSIILFLHVLDILDILDIYFS